MHFEIPIILAFGATIANTMAVPSINNSTILKRNHFPWVGSFTNPTCSGNPDPHGQRPEMRNQFGNCQGFQFVVGDAVGINFGSGVYQLEGVTFFSDDNCQTVSELNNWHTVTPGPDGMGCVQPLPGTVVNSMKPGMPS